MKKSVAILYLLFPYLTIAGGFELNTQGQKAVGMGGAFSGIANDASALYYNPAAIAFHEHALFNAGFDLVLPRVSFLSQTEGNIDAENVMMFPMHLFITHRFDNKKLTGGVAIYSPFGTSVEWDDKWPGRFLTQKTKLNTLYLQPTITYRLNEHFSAAVGLIGATGGLTIETAFAVNDDLLESLNGRGFGYGFNLGGFAHYERLNFSVNYRSAVKLNFNNGDANFNEIPPSFLDLQTFPRSTDFEASFKLPSTITFGIGYFPTERISADIDVCYSTWSQFKDWNIEHNNYPELNSNKKREFKNTFSFKLGGTYYWSDKMEYRFGLNYSSTPSTQGNVYPDLPTGLGFGIGAGATRQLNKSFSIDASFHLSNNSQQKEVDNKQNFNGSYQKTTYSIGLGVQYEF